MSGNRIINGNNFNCLNLRGLQLENFIGFYEGGLSEGINILLIKFKEKNMWQCFFLDAGIGFWEEYDQVSAFEDYDVLAQIDIREKYRIGNSIVQSICCEGSSELLSELIFKFESVTLTLKYMDSEDLNSETVLALL